MVEVVLKARTDDIGQWVQDCADGTLAFDELCCRVAAQGFKTTSLYEMVCAARLALRRATSSGIFPDHSCWKCLDGKKACVVGNPRQCEYPHARND